VYSHSYASTRGTHRQYASARATTYRPRTATHCNALQHTATHCNTLRHNATHYSTMQHTATQCSTLQHTATHCNTLQHTETTHPLALLTVLMSLTLVIWFGTFSTGWRRPIGCLKLQVIFRKIATDYRALLRKMTCKDKASYDSTPLCSPVNVWVYLHSYAHMQFVCYIYRGHSYKTFVVFPNTAHGPYRCVSCMISIHNKYTS